MKLRTIVIGAALFGVAGGADAAGVAYKPDQDNAPVRKHRRTAHRAPYRECCGEGYRFVYAESWYGFKKVVAPVRRAEHGDEVRLPGGTWVYCEFSCEYTLRRQSLDFWQGQGAGGQSDQVSPGYFRKDFYIDDWGRRHGYLF
jgi:hypothetical protein